MRENFDLEWYNSLKKPEFQPPASVFAPVWVVLYATMFFSLVFIMATPFKWNHIIAYLLFLIQLGVNLSWPQAFFKEHNLRKSFFVCLFLSFLVFLTIPVFFSISKLAAFLLVPYFLWCTFAVILSFELWELNSD